MIILKSANEIARMRDAGRIAAQAHELLRKMVAPGITTAELDQAADEFIRQAGGIPTFHGYRGFPASICTSVNEVIVHGIPGKQVLQDGDIISIDLGVTYQGYVADVAYTWPVGNVSEEARRLLQVTEESLYKGIEQAVAGKRVGDIGHAVQTHAERAGFSVVREFVGHGVGQSMHEAPQVPNFGAAGRGPKLKIGMVLAIEPMINCGVWQTVTDDDGWTVRTKDGKWSAHFEHTVAITENGPQILTIP